MRRMDDLGLDIRTGLPDALRVLLDKHPRAGWEAHAHFGPLTRFWLERHLMFRQLQAALLDGTRAHLDRAVEPQRYATQLARLGSLLLGELHGHHGVEDAHYFPLLAAQDARLEPGFELLDRDHRQLDARMAGLATAANAVLERLAARERDTAAAGRLLGELEGFERFLERHLTDEEELVVPVILEYRPRELS
jgi:hypothetical protein